MCMPSYTIYQVLHLKTHNCIAFLLLSRYIWLMLQVLEAEVMSTINDTIHLHQTMCNIPCIGCLPKSLALYQTTYLSYQFWQLYFSYHHFNSITINVFSPVWISFQALLLLLPPNIVQPSYPYLWIFPNITSLAPDDHIWLLYMLQWDPWWGYTQWHVSITDSASFQVHLILWSEGFISPF